MNEQLFELLVRRLDAAGLPAAIRHRRTGPRWRGGSEGEASDGELFLQHLESGQPSERVDGLAELGAVLSSE